MFDRRPNSLQDEKVVADALKRLPVVKAPDSIWQSIEASLDAPVSRPEPRTAWLWNRWAWAAATALVVAGVTLYWHSTPRPRWEVIRTSAGATHTESVQAGDWLQTDASSTAEIHVGDIGTVDIKPNTRLRIVATKPLEHRLSLDHGEISATISAPPKLFFVDTKSATAVDLGCQYRMKVDEAGNGLLSVTLGWVAFEWQGRESLVPMGAQCRTHAGAGPGTPFFEDAPKNLTAALDEFDFAGEHEAALRAILANARPRDTLTLWHLLSRVKEPLRSLVYDRMVGFAQPPAGVTREKVLALDPQALKMWKDELAWTW